VLSCLRGNSLDLAFAWQKINSIAQCRYQHLVRALPLRARTRLALDLHIALK
jgi:hypothetical protein